MHVLCMHEENHIALGRVHIGIFEQKDSIHSIFLEHRELDKQPDWASQVLAYNEVLFTADLDDVSACGTDD